MLSENIYHLIYNIIIFIIKFNYDYYYIFNFILNEIPEILEFIAFCIYLEIIELKFCDLNINIRKNIIIRAESDLDDQLNNNNSFIEDNNDIDEEEKNNELIKLNN